MDDAISTAVTCLCECCNKYKICKMYVLQDGSTTFVCKDCRNGKVTK